MAHDRVRPARDELVVVAHGHLPGEELPERPMAPYSDQSARDSEEARRGGQWREVQFGCSEGMACALAEGRRREARMREEYG